jgi:outer membrane protein OmpA-like peptidoglycan-associated protein
MGFLLFLSLKTNKNRCFKILLMYFAKIFIPLLLSTMSLCLSNQLLAQKPKVSSTDSVKKASVIVNVTNADKQPRKGELVIFKSAKSNKKISSRTNAEGKAFLSLPAGDEYAVTIQALSDSSKYGTLPIPALGEGEFFEQPFAVNITYEPARSFTLNHVFFDVGKASLRPESFKELDELFEYMRWKTADVIEIAGHTDNVGKDDDNLKLSQFRADAVRNYLLKKGIAKERVQAKGYGATKPVADNSTTEGRQQNRRTEVHIL